MAVKLVSVPDIGQVAIYKRRGVKSLKLSIAHDGTVRLTMPSWTPIRAGMAFVLKNKKWINEHRDTSEVMLINGSRIGKAHYLIFTNSASDKQSTRIVGNEIRIILPSDMSYISPEAQAIAKKGSIKALKKEAEQLLPDRLNYLANRYGFTYRDVKVKQLKSRWGSCSSNKDINLSIYLMQLPWDLIDYVILHELTHTKVLAHGKKFWDELDTILPNSRSMKKEVNKYKPAVTPSINLSKEVD